MNHYRYANVPTFCNYRIGSNSNMNTAPPGEVAEEAEWNATTTATAATAGNASTAATAATAGMYTMGTGFTGTEFTLIVKVKPKRKYNKKYKCGVCKNNNIAPLPEPHMICTKFIRLKRYASYRINGRYYPMKICEKCASLLPSRPDDRANVKEIPIPRGITQSWARVRKRFEKMDRKRDAGTPIDPTAVAFFSKDLIIRTGKVGSVQDYRWGTGTKKSPLSNLSLFGASVNVAFGAAGDFWEYTGTEDVVRTSLIVNDIICAEQAIMISKLIVMSGIQAVRNTALGRVLTMKMSTGSAYKKLSHMIYPFNASRWKDAAPTVALSAARLKVSRSPLLLDIIAKIGQQDPGAVLRKVLFVEAAGSSDTVWGSGDTFNNRVLVPAKKRGENYMGLAYTVVFHEFLDEKEIEMET